MNHSTWQDHTRAVSTLVLVKALRRAHDNAHGIIVLWSNPEVAQQELRRRQKQTRDRGKYHRRGGGGFGGGSGGGSEGGSGKDGGGVSHSGVTSITIAVIEAAESVAVVLVTVG